MIFSLPETGHKMNDPLLINDLKARGFYQVRKATLVQRTRLGSLGAQFDKLRLMEFHVYDKRTPRGSKHFVHVLYSSSASNTMFELRGGEVNADKLLELLNFYGISLGEKKSL